MAWKKVAKDTVALLSAEAGRHPYDRRLSDHRGAVHPKRRIRDRWAAPDVQIHSTGVQLIHHPVVSDLDLSLRPSHWTPDPSQMLITYTAEPGSPSQYAPRVSWPAGPRPATASGRPPRLIPRRS